jgi:hypothetical protein
VITSKKGSARFPEDVPISDDYKFRDSVASIPAIATKIRQCFDLFAKSSTDFDHYRTVILAQEAAFDSEVDDLFRLQR